LFASLSAHAGVLYRWVDAAPDPDTGPIEAFIEFGAEYWEYGKTLQAIDRYSDSYALEAYFGVESFYFTLPAQPGLNGFGPLKITSDTTCSDYVNTLRFCPADLLPDTRVALFNSGDVSRFAFDLVLGTSLSGSIVMNNGTSDFRMESAGGLFTLTRLGSDGGACYRAGLCDGGTGYFQLDASTIPRAPVPVPQTLALFAIGVLILGQQAKRQGCAARL
jgi:hypothetical protein